MYNELTNLTRLVRLYRFVDCVQKDQERLSVVSADLRSIFETFDISPRFAGYISRQHMPGSATRFDQTTDKPHRHGRCQELF